MLSIIFEIIIFGFRKEELKLVDANNITSDYEGWLIFNMTEVLTDWVVFPHSNKGVYLSLTSLDWPGLYYSLFRMCLFSWRCIFKH